MEKFNDILKEIEQTYKAIKAAEARENELVKSYMGIENFKERHEARKAAENDIIKAREEKKNLQITIKILRNNAKIALFNEVLPVALEVLKKYKGKPYGEKTKEKISEEVKAATNCRFYIGSSYASQSFNIYPVDTFGTAYNISCGTEYKDGNNKVLLINNKIQLITFDEIALYYIDREYIEDIPHRVEELKQLYNKAVAKQKELETICNKYNALAVGDLQHIYKDKNIYENMQI